LLPLHEDPRFAAALELFERGDFFEASDAFEELFFESVREEVPVARAMLQASVGALHSERGQRRAAVDRLKEAMRALDAITDPHGLDVARIRAEVERLIAANS
jgi:predicted metal-dependent hydrolase